MSLILMRLPINRFYKTIVCLMLLFWLALCSCGPKVTALPKDAVILAFGDSITRGIGAEPEQSYPALLSKLTGRNVVEAGIPGEVTAEGLARLSQTLDQVKPALVILCHGGNDLIRRLGDDQADRNIRAMIKLIKSRNISVLLVGVPKPGIFLSSAKFYEEAAKDAGIPYEGDILPAILKDNALKADPIHPNATGYRMMAEAIARLLKKSDAI